MAKRYTVLMHKIIAYLNGNWVAASELHIAVDDAGFLLGTTVTERLRTFRGQIFRLEEHLARLRGSLRIVGLDSDAVGSEVGAAITEFVNRNRGLIDLNDDWAVIAFVTPGCPGSGRPTVCVHGYPLPFHHWADQFEIGVPVVVSSHRQIPNNCWPTELKCRSRMHYYLADREAAARRPGARAIVLDQDGYIAEGTTANIVIYRDGEGLISPPYEHILAGVSLAVLKELAAITNTRFVIRPTSIEDLRTADEAMFTSTSICVLPIIDCDGDLIGSGCPGPVYRRLLAEWSDFVGVDVAEQARRFAKRSN